MLYLLNFNTTYIIILATCFDFYESSSGIISRTIVHIVLQFFCLTVFVLDENCKTICTIVLEIMPEDDS